MRELQEHDLAYIRYEFKYSKTVETAEGARKVDIYYSHMFNCWDREYWGTPFPVYGKPNFPVGPRVDMRTLEMLQSACCPPSLMKDFIMQEGGEMVEKDPVLEAMKLHKRGYFGGGG